MAIVGVSDHAGWAVFVIVEGTKLVDRRRVTLVAEELPSLPHHHEAQVLSPGEGVELVERVTASALQHARIALSGLAVLPVTITGIALRECAELPATIAERITSYRAQCMADGIMYRTALANAAHERDWLVYWYDAKHVIDATTRDLVEATGKALGPPWRHDHKIAMAAAIRAAQ